MAFTYVTYRITCESSGASVSGKAINIFHVTAGSDTTLPLATINGILTDLKALYTPAATYMTTNWTIGSRVLEYLPNGDAPVIIGATPQVQAMSGSQAMPPQLAAVISWRTPKAGPSFRGRTFLGPLNQTAFSATSLSGAFTAAMNTAATTLITALQTRIGGNGGLVIRSEVKKLDTPVVSATMNSKVDTLRKRA